MPLLPATYFFDEIEQALTSSTLTIRQRSVMAYRLLVELLNEATAEAEVGLSGTFPRLHYVCTHLNIPPEVYRRLNDFRVRMSKVEQVEEITLSQVLPYDLRLLAKFVARLKETAIPAALEQLLPKQDRAWREEVKIDTHVRRVVLATKHPDFIEVLPADHPTGTALKIWLTTTDETRDFRYLYDLLRPGMSLNLIDTKSRDEGLEAALIIVEPDYLVDVTAISSCFQPFGITPDLHVVHRFLPAPTGRPLLLGNFASQLLDEAVHQFPLNYAASIQRFFKTNALSLAATLQSAPLADFHQEAQQQQQNLYNLVGRQFVPELHVDNHEEVLLEPSFFCEMLGVQGRMDLLTRDLDVVIEQKSGKKEFATQGPHLHHRIQVLLYMAILHYAHHKRYSEINAYLLYSKYAGKEGLIRVQNVPKLLQQAFEVRNRMVVRDLEFAERGSADFFEEFTPEQLHTLSCGVLWERYKLPEYLDFINVFRSATPEERAYFFRFHRFLALEQLRAKLGSSQREASGFAAAWLSTLDEKMQAGNIMPQLCLDRGGYKTSATGAILEVRLLFLTAPREEDISTVPNFRKGDIVVFYSYEALCTPDLREGMVFRATIGEITPTHIVLRLRAPQTNPRIFDRRSTHVWAIEPDLMEASATALYRGLYAFLSGEKHRRRLLTHTCTARVDTTRKRQLSFDTPELDTLVEKAVQARDFFLLVGPPGTGKTSYGLMSLLKEELATAEHQVLLGAFTNRAVDEICSKLVAAGLDFLRIGNALTCSEEYLPYLLENRTSEKKNVAEITQLLQTVRVVVGTTASLSAATSLFALKHFSLAIIDEASQLLEPHLLPLLMAEHHGQLAVERFVFIGDHKQLPAVVQQSERESQVDDARLHKMGLTNCRCSLFERLIQILPERCVHAFHRQGRMHPEVARFANVHFYGGLLRPIPLDHQRVVSPYRRVMFYPCVPDESSTFTPKTNQAEAQLIAHLCRQLYQETQECEPLQIDWAVELGIIVPYRHQIALIRRELHLACPELSGITIDTVERFQGSERETIIFGFTVSRQSQLNFLCNSQFVDETGHFIDRKLNVALTRARQRTLLVGNPHLLREVPLFAELIDECVSPSVE